MHRLPKKLTKFNMSATCDTHQLRNVMLDSVCKQHIKLNWTFSNDSHQCHSSESVFAPTDGQEAQEITH